jgi:hypothetical protein
MAKTTIMALTMGSLLGLSLVAAAPVAAQDPVECVGGTPSYWQDPAHAWPVFNVPKAFTKPGGEQVTVGPSTGFDRVFRYRRPHHDEGRILPGMTMKQVLHTTGGGLNGLARQSVAALLNAASIDLNQFQRTRGYVIDQFQVYWDGTLDMSPQKARKVEAARFFEDNQAACPVT